MEKLCDFSAIVEAENRNKAMATFAVARPRPDLDAHRKAASAEFPQLVDALVSIIGRKLTAYVASVKDARAIDRWRHKATPQKDVERRLRLTYHVAAMLAQFDSPEVVQAWLIGLNPELDDQAPIGLLRDGDIEADGKRVLSAARAFVADG
jgi:hypothetical protein